MTYLLTFKRGGHFFEPVLSYFSSWLLYCIATRDRYVKNNEVGEGRIRGQVISQLIFNEPDFLSRIRKQQAIDSITFSVLSESPPLQQGQRIPDKDLNIFWLQQMIGCSFESVLNDILDKYGPRQKKDRKTWGRWPGIFEFFYHLRNGCFHGNKFNIRLGNISFVNQPRWRSKEISMDSNGKNVIGDFLGRADCIHYLYDVEQELNR